MRIRYDTGNQTLIKTKGDCWVETEKHQRAYSGEGRGGGSVLPVVAVAKAAPPRFLLILLIRAVKRIQQSQRIVSTRGPPVGLRVLRFTVASLSCPRQQHLSPSVWAARHSQAFSCLFVFSWFSSPNLSHIVFTWHLTERSSLKHCQNSQI